MASWQGRLFWGSVDGHEGLWSAIQRSWDVGTPISLPNCAYSSPKGLHAEPEVLRSLEGNLQVMRGLWLSSGSNISMVDLSAAQLPLLGSQPPLALDGKQVLGSDTKYLLRVEVSPLSS